MIRFTTILLALVLAPAAQAAGGPFQAGEQFERIEPAQPGAEGDRVRVSEFFWYGCPHCYELEPLLQQWAAEQPEYVELVQVPAMFNRPDVRMHAEAFYALDLMGELERIHPRIFEAMHEEDRKLRSRESFESFLQEEGVDMEEFRRVSGSFAVQTSLRRAAVLTERYGVRSVPALVVDGSYRTGPGSAGGYTRTLEVADHLIERVRAEKTKD